MLHSWGVGCGLAVTVTPSLVDGEPEPWSVTVSAGYALSGCGDEVCLPGDVRVDIRSPRPDGSNVCGPPVDPWCAPVRERRDPDRTYFLAIRYAEQQTRPVRATSCGCGCDDDPCEYSRIAESYTLAVLDDLPECYQVHLKRGDDGGPATDANQALARQEAYGCSPRIQQTGTRPCPDCCSPWVVLADLTVSATGAVVVDQLAHRRFLASFGSYGFTCAVEVEPDRPILVLKGPDREVLRTAFSAGAADMVESSEPQMILAQPASLLRGATRTNALRELMGGRTIAELATSDLDALKAAAIGAKVAPEEVDDLHALAGLVSRVIRT
jgi:hypothetical protein